MGKLVEGNWYRFGFDNGEYIGQYTGRDQGFECCVCGKGCKAHTFNIWYSKEDYETWGFGRDHLPVILEDLGEQDDIIIGE